MQITGEIRRLIYEDRDASTLRQAQKQNGGYILREEAVLQAIEGRTSLEEALRVTRREDVSAEPRDAHAPRMAA